MGHGGAPVEPRAALMELGLEPSPASVEPEAASVEPGAFPFEPGVSGQGLRCFRGSGP